MWKFSCVAELDPIYREFAKSPTCDTSDVKDLSSEAYEFKKNCEVFRNNGNPTCGVKNFAKIYEESTNDATTFSGHVALFSLIMCIIFAFFK